MSRPFDFKLILVPFDSWLWKSFDSAVNYSIVAYRQITMIDLGGELGRRTNQPGHVLGLFPRDHLFRDFRRIFGHIHRTQTYFITGSNAEFEFVAHDQILDIGLTVAHVVKSNVPIALRSGEFVTFFNLFVESV